MGPVSVDLAELRCPDLPAADLATLRQPAAAAPDGAVTKSAAQRWVDRLGEQVRAKGAAGERIAWQYRACRASAQDKAGS